MFPWVPMLRSSALGSLVLPHLSENVTAAERLACVRGAGLPALQRHHMHRRRDSLVSLSVSQPPAPMMKSPHRHRIHTSRGRLRDELRILAVGSMPKGPRPCQISGVPGKCLV